MATISKGERLLNLVAFLLKSRRPAPVGEIRNSVIGYCDDPGAAASPERRFERDKAALRELGVPIRFIPDGDPGGPGYVLPRDVHFLPHIHLTSQDAAVLALAGRFALTGAAGPVSDALRSALLKLQFDSPIPGGIRETAEEHLLFHRIGSGPDTRERANLSELTAAILNRRVVKFPYYAIGHGRTTNRTVSPYGIGFADGHWYLVGHDRARMDVRVFRADRIRGRVKRRSFEASRPEFTVPANFRVQDYVGVPPWLFGKASRTAVRMRLDRNVAFMVRMNPAPGDQWRDAPDGSAILVRNATHLDALLRWVLGFGRHVKVLDPPDFRRRVAGALRAVAARHEPKRRKGAGNA